jgi:two-component sensor histidine kinase
MHYLGKINYIRRDMRTPFAFVLLFFLGTNFCLSAEKPLDQEIKELESGLKNNPTNLASTLRLSECYNLNSQYYKSLNLLNAFQQPSKIQDLNQIAEINLALAKTYKFLDDNGQAELHFLKSSDAFLKAKNYEGYVKCGIEQIEFSRRTRRFKEGAQRFYYYSHFAKKKGITNRKIWIGLYNRFAAVLNETKHQHRNSIRYSNKALALAIQAGDKQSQAISYNELGFAYHNLQQKDSALISYKKAESTYKEMNHLREYVHVWYNILILKMEYNLTSVNQQIDELWKLARYVDSAKVDYYKTEIYHSLRQLYFAKGDYKASCEADFIYEKNLTKEFHRVQNQKMEEVAARYKNQELAVENSNLKEREKRERQDLENTKFQVILFALALLIVVLALCGIFYLWYQLKRSNKLLTERNEQKTVLIQEVHHRVKNNLQFVRSMLELQTNNTESEAEADNLSDVSRRIDAMSLVHEMLYMDAETLGISLKDYLEQLIHHSGDSFPQHLNVEFKTSIVNKELTIDKLVAIGVICSELFTNSIKYAFNNTVDPCICVSVTEEKDKALLLTVKDNGTESIPEHNTKSSSLGMRLIDIFCRQLNGTYSIDRSKGYLFQLKFPV